MSWSLFMACALLLGEPKGIESETRRRRHLVFTRDDFDRIQLILGLGLPITGVPDSNINLGIILQFSYDLPSNASELRLPHVSLKKRESDSVATSRWHVYSHLEAVASSVGLDGKACLLRTICDAASERWYMDGILGELLHVILTPSTTDETGDGAYLDAERRGATFGRPCQHLYPGCSVQLLDAFTEVYGHRH